MPKILLINGPNLNLLGTREPDIYGTQTLTQMVNNLEELLVNITTEPITLQHIQSNHEGDLVNAIHAAYSNTDWIIINAGAYTHTSIAIRDALAGVGIPFVEVHLSNVYAREVFRHHSYLSDLATGVVAGLGYKGYEAALRFCVEKIQATSC